ELLLEVAVEAQVEPQPAADPHEACPLRLGERTALLDARRDLVMERLRGIPAPLRSAMPLRNHDGRDAVVHAYGARRGARDEVAGALVPLRLLVAELHDAVELLAIELRARVLLEPRDEL